MKITIISTEKVNSKYTKEAISEYSKRLSAFTKIEYIVSKNPTKDIPNNTYVIQINTKGKNITSEELAQKMDYITTHGQSHIVFLLNISLDISSDFSLAISPMEIGMDILPIVLYEQIYRAFTIISGKTYHK
ncbi:23S rRNA (pseudouridine(1915)-N(3))-methyltransferase RlmH [Tissierella sp.]|uniref:23S rRNA (pseudouridine(1915)-N(3))-methyltransferase RlmH n=1 Tax=Tissierella sp. TaxID=41274 RepID=UPI00285956C4|nr:23S rRNA (pseudouridine(1915)-N(3))-methyltransferase RlmH [Tissierella sp.]MDR7855011.1 23S rRNA (pseudouridine(1915)-N(3))-methyltransferase RlmH [Tissierella sp.]